MGSWKQLLKSWSSCSSALVSRPTVVLCDKRRDILEEFNPKCLSADWCRVWKSFLIMIHPHLEFMSEAVWAVNDVLFYYYIWNVSRLTCMLKRLLIKHGSRVICHCRPAVSIPASCSSYKRHKHISTLINAIKWSNDFSGATVTRFMCSVAQSTLSLTR